MRFLRNDGLSLALFGLFATPYPNRPPQAGELSWRDCSSCGVRVALPRLWTACSIDVPLTGGGIHGAPAVPRQLFTAPAVSPVAM
jgi:hypothetical protein